MKSTAHGTVQVKNRTVHYNVQCTSNHSSALWIKGEC